MTDPNAVTFVRSTKPSSDQWYDTARDRLRVQSGDAQAFARWRIALAAGKGLDLATVTARGEEPLVGTWTARSVDPDGNYRRMTWNTRPANAAGSADRTGALSNRVVTWDVTADVEAALAADLDRLALRLSCSSATRQWLRTASLELTLTTFDLAVTPSGVSPAGVVGVQKPVFTWLAPAGITKVQVQVDDTGEDFSTPVWDSGELTQTTPRVDSATGAAWAGISGTMTARVQHFTTAAGWSDWAQVSLTYDAPTNFVLSNPTGSDADATPPSVWTPAAAAVQIVSYLDGVKVDDTGLISGPVSDHTPTVGARTPGQVLKRIHHFHDGQQRVQPATIVRTTETTWTPTGSVAGLTTLAAAQDGDLPVVESSWTRSAGTPDEVGLQHGDQLVAVVDGPDGSYRDWTVPPNNDVVYGGRAVVNGAHSSTLRTVALRTKVTGVWLVDPVTERGVIVAGLDLAIGYGGEVVVHTPIDGAVLLRRTLTRRGPEGTVAGRLKVWPGRTREECLADVEWLAERPERTLRLIMGDLNVPVTVSSLQAIFDKETFFTDRPEHLVSFDCSHAGGY